MLNLKENVQIRPLGDSALVIQVGEGINETIQKKVQNILNLLESHPFQGFIEAVPAYNSVTVYYNPIDVYFSNLEKGVKIPYENVKTKILSLMNQSHIIEMSKERVVKIPVVYGGEMGPDLEFVASYNGLTPSEVIKIHSSAEYLVYMIGFAPGFPFMGGMNKQIATPRKETPRLAIAPGSVGIAGNQTGIYPLETPGGWQIIGRTPFHLFLPEQSPPTLLQPGDRIQFVPISMGQYKMDWEMESWE
ncbi:5-oxoprolinase subunit PxpB [Rummeliibacillus sp. NPDC094406]|uniref:5-oxoprolinase subunit PxpB n=1 Tax=Rummeliibacillus sp. NPDC094406 TaxID=3364511 RepID=UPI00380B2CC1